MTRMIKLTRPAKRVHSDDTPSSLDMPEQVVYVNSTHIVSVQTAASGGSMLFLGRDTWVHVAESAQAIAHLVNDVP